MNSVLNAWRQASGRQRIVIVVALLVTLGVVAAGLQSTGGFAVHTSRTASPSLPQASTVAIGPTQSPTPTLSASLAPTPTLEATPTLAPTVNPTSQPTARVTLGPTPGPTPEPSMALAFTSLTSPAARGSYATATVRTAPAAYCTIVVIYKSGPSSAAGLTPKNADGSGVASWTWKVGTGTTVGSWPVTVTCSSGGLSASVTQYFQVV